MLFSKKPETVESLTKKCKQQFKDFRHHVTLAHYRTYADFKLDLYQNCYSLSKEITFCKDPELGIKLLTHLNEQLSFINEYCFSCPKETLESFVEKNYPYMETVRKIIDAHGANHNKTETPKAKVSP